MTARQHLRAAACFAAIVLHLGCWSLLLLLLLPAKAARPTRPWFRRQAGHIYRAAVSIDNLLLRRISRVRCVMDELELDPTRPHVVVSNHRSWADVFLVQKLIATRGPIVTFLSKRELIWLPIVGMVIIAFDFPMLRRRQPAGGDAAKRRADDRRRVREAAARLLEAPTAILSFAEGTRFTRQKHAARKGPWQRLLPPRAGGLTELVDCLAPAGGSIVDVTLVYSRDVTFWEFLGGAAGWTRVAWEATPIAEVHPDTVGTWLNERWRRKDELLRQVALQADDLDLHKLSESLQDSQLAAAPGLPTRSLPADPEPRATPERP